MAEKKLLVYAPDKGGDNPKPRFLDLETIQNYYYHLVVFTGNFFTDGYPDVVRGDLIADVSVADYAEEHEGLSGLISSIKTSDLFNGDFDWLEWVEHD